jgi:hypothetical protein
VILDGKQCKKRIESFAVRYCRFMARSLKQLLLIAVVYTSNWFLSVNTPSNETTDDTTGRVSQSKAMSAVSQLKIGYSAHLTNNMPYARRIEYEGWSNQAPAGMLRVTVEKAKPELRKLGFEVQ